MILQVKDIVKDAMGLLNLLEVDETPTDSEIRLGIRTLNIMIDSWSAKHLILRSMTSESFSLTANVSVYTIGPGATFNTSKPLSINSSFIRDTGGVDFPMDVVTKGEWNNFIDKNIAPSRPVALYYDPGFAQQNSTPTTGGPSVYNSLTTYAAGDYCVYGNLLYVSLTSGNLNNTPSSSPSYWSLQNANYGTIYLYYTPDAPYTLFIDSDKYLNEFSDPTDTVTFEPMYYEALIYNLAMRLWRQYKKPETQVSADIAHIAREALKAIENRNARQVVAGIETPGHISSFNIYAGDYVD